jgi:hypothetical protein
MGQLGYTESVSWEDMGSKAENATEAKSLEVEETTTTKVDGSETEQAKQ